MAEQIDPEYINCRISIVDVAVWNTRSTTGSSEEPSWSFITL